MTIVTAIGIIGDAYERCNRLSPGETLSADDAAFGFRRLNLLVDEISGSNQFLFQNLITSAAQTGHITLGAAPWAAIDPSDEIITMAASGWLLSPITMAQYNAIPVPSYGGQPDRYCHDGLSTVFLYPVPTGQTLRIQTRKTVSSFADQATSYTVPNGYQAYLGAALAVRIAPNIMGQVPAGLVDAERKCKLAINNYQPSILDARTFAPVPAVSRILQGP